MTGSEPPLPRPTPVARPFWDGLREHRVLIQYSPSTAAWVFYPRLLAPGTLADDLEWREVSGRGVLHTFAIARRPTAPPWQDRVPQLIAVVELHEGPRLTTELTDVAPGTLAVGLPVRPVFVDSGEVTLLKYTLDP